MNESESDTEKFRFLIDKARACGAADARIIPAGQIVIEDRVRQKCVTGCFEYGKHLTCPPYAPEVEAFKKSVAEYRYTLVVKFRSEAEFGEEIRYSLMQELIDPHAKKESKESAFLLRSPSHFFVGRNPGLFLIHPVHVSIKEQGFSLVRWSLHPAQKIAICGNVIDGHGPAAGRFRQTSLNGQRLHCMEYVAVISHDNHNDIL